MRGNHNGFSNLGKQRYYVATDDNVLEVTQYNSAFASSNPPELFMAFPYLDLINKLKQNFSIDNDPSSSAIQQYRNHLSTLNGYLAFCGKTIESNVGTELAGGFDTKLREYLNTITVAPRTRRDRAQHLKSIQQLYKASLTAPQTTPVKQSTLGATLRLRIAETGLAPKTLAKEAGVDPTTLWRWLRGAQPRADTLPALRRLEARLNLARDTLVSLIDKTLDESLRSSTAVPSHRLRMSQRQNHNLTLPESSLSPTFLQEWRTLFDYKTSDFPTLERQPRGNWRLIPQSVSKALSSLAQRGSMVCPTANIFIERMRSFLGVLTNLAPESGGMTWEEPPQQTLAWCAHPQALECFLQWMTSQSEGIRHNGQKVFARAVASLLRPQTGFLWQQAASYRLRLPEAFRPPSDEAWREMCAKSHKLLRSYIRSATGVSRNPEEPIADLLNSPNPLQPIRDAIARINADAAEAPPGSITEARHKRNALILALLLSNPMRARTLVSLTWFANGNGTVRGSVSQGWRIQLEPLHEKTGSSRQSRQYAVKVASWVKPLMDEYIEEFRDTLLRGKSSPYLLVGDENGEIWEGLGQTVRLLTRRYIPGSPGFGPHAVRHLVATDWLRKNPGDFLTVAELLNDTLPTVLQHYAHLRRDDSFARYEAYIASLE